MNLSGRRIHAQDKEIRVLYGCKSMQINNPHYKSTFKNFIKVVRLWTDGKAGIPITGFND